MGKHEVGTPKYIANKIKSKGLQKLRWYCQMCQKQCRDENGFKCHTMSESHHRQLLLFADNAGKYMDQFSREFSDGFLHLLKRQFGTRRVLSNRVYQDYITDRQHMHMNATQWLSLTAYVKWLGRTGKCVVDETEKGWYITYIDRDPETVAAEEKKAKKQKMDKDDEERLMEFISKQVEKGSVENKNKSEESATPLIRSEEDGPLVLEMKLKPKASLLMGPPVGLVKKSVVKIKEEPSDSDNVSVVDWNENDRSREPSECRSTISCKRKSDDDDSYKKLKADSRSSEDKPSTSQGWLQENLVVKVITESLGSKYYKAKGVVLSPVLESGFVGKIKLTSPEKVQGHIVKLDQEHLETVIPAIGREVMIIQGKYRGSVGTVEKVRVEDFAVDVNITRDDKYVKRIPYESVCKFIR
ncbi:DNA/RNA-binding protein KIN17 isoform X1 [Microplitis demolitor]|uniref:DNA/RNA-binding protein KIN17 isoform X1 n=1 Tax=Microplitis demolitor TaxID=69319 RepID=UPI0004CD34B5|nr:DNA/RNA-binding protein KIN17 isoform X1 [Microplitis demolitor]XP_053594286.1 DNA/RNA-binding protein KIN17 isoform X1 [Microplitis demolitor]